uniref:Uncharacterized protein n=1 Tax=Ciona savignyi TaxID=51511 RepID=H2YWP5_CIOSA
FQRSSHRSSHRPFDHDLKTWLEQASLKKS